ncbi:pentapeptide repeat-containing protein [Streptomyces sp. BK239]|uniref:pentapeptide repeat-containing protein n=1 Tax=Streptomyces sp. BK239 TaxID=2512155 RepID=UPI00102CA6B2|nr:pentapeptide repeat-containing protein [Streptomyces sp. BK239]RZU14335.1 uncharacterized protein YjbI with pentapeptide repeats [Streptomyces sp. BK239]
MSAPPSVGPSPPFWDYCGHCADPATDPVGCRGILVPGHTACLAHLDSDNRDAYYTGLRPGAEIDHRGTPFTEGLLRALLQAIHDPTGQPRLGDARFNEATFYDKADFGNATFSGDAWFDKAKFSGDAWFNEARFSGTADFGNATFSGDAWFVETMFSDEAQFEGVTFSGDARFMQATFSGDAGFKATFSSSAVFQGATFLSDAEFSEVAFSSVAVFQGVTFSGDALFGASTFSGDAWFAQAKFFGNADIGGVTFLDEADFGEAQFGGASSFGPVVCAVMMDLSAAVFKVPVTFEIAARALRCERTRWESTATLRLRYATVDLGDAVLSDLVAVIAYPAPFTTRSGAAVGEAVLSGAESGVRVVSVRGVDAALLVLTDSDLSDCQFAGSFHLDQLRLEGDCAFAPVPAGLHRRHFIWPHRWTRRSTLAEEHHWRALTTDNPVPPAGQGPSPGQWRTGPDHPDPGLTPDPEDVAALYRQLRKAFEDGKNEPGAADFYYGEMEMRRHDRNGTPRGERGLLWAYWLLSGYGLRASRALVWLVAAMAVTVVLLMGFGLPDTSLVPVTGGQVTVATDKRDPQLTLPLGDRFNEKRFDEALPMVVNSVVFRSSGQNLTTAGTYIEMASRLLEPVLLALAILAIRGRVKR